MSFPEGPAFFVFWLPVKPCWVSFFHHPSTSLGEGRSPHLNPIRWGHQTWKALMLPDLPQVSRRLLRGSSVKGFRPEWFTLDSPCDFWWVVIYIYIQGCAVIIYMALNICSNSGCCKNDPYDFGWVPPKQMFFPLFRHLHLPEKTPCFSSQGPVYPVWKW